MDISYLILHAKQKYNLIEEFRWQDHPGFSVLCHPKTYKIVALVIRQWSSKLGREIQHCDLRCGRRYSGYKKNHLWVTDPIWMKGDDWLGIRFGEWADDFLIYSMLDEAVRRTYSGPATIVLNRKITDSDTVYEETVIPYSPADTTDSFRQKPGYSDSLSGAVSYGIPEKIQQMRELYDFSDRKPGHKIRNFIRQARFMEDYEDHQSWNGRLNLYCPTYHDLNIVQLRGYFAWRASIRKNWYIPASRAFIYLYIFELLNGIGSGSDQEVLEKLDNFRQLLMSNPESDSFFIQNLDRWRNDFVIIHNLPPQEIRHSQSEAQISYFADLKKLRDPDDHSDEEIVESLVRLGKGKAGKTLLKNDRTGKAAHMLAEVWRHLQKNTEFEGRTLYEICFGQRVNLRWYPFSNAACPVEPALSPYEYTENEFTKYIYENGRWFINRCSEFEFSKHRFLQFFRTADRLLRKKLKIRSDLKPKEDEAWIAPAIEEALIQIEKKEEEEARPKVVIDFSHLDRIRQDASATRDSLLTEEELGRLPADASDSATMEIQPETERKTPMNGRELERVFGHEHKSAESALRPEQMNDADDTEAEASEVMNPRGDSDRADLSGGSDQEEKGQSSQYADGENFGLEPDLIRLVKMMRDGKNPQNLIDQNHWLPSVVADTVNEAFFDEIGDSVIEYGGAGLQLVEDYTEDLQELLGGD